MGDRPIQFPVAFHDLPERAFPFTVEALHPLTRAVVWSTTIEKPPAGQKVAVLIPPLRELLGHPVMMRCRFADGTESEQGPPSFFMQGEQGKVI